MAQRRMLPAMRKPVELETKGWSSSYGYSGGMTPAVNVLGMKDRSAGWDLDKVIEQGYERIPWVFKCVEVIAANASRLPFELTDADGNTVTTHPLLRVLNRRANPMETGRQFRKRLSALLLLSKRGVFIEVTRNNAGQISRLDLLTPDRVRVVPSTSGDYIDYYEYTRPDGEVRQLAPERVRWIREPHPLDPFSGVTPLEAAGYSVELDHLARVYNVNFINRDARPGGILGVDADGLTDEELDRIESRLAPGPYMAGQITALGTGPGGLNYVDTAAKPRDMAYETTSDRAKKEILAAFGVPDTKVGDSSGKTYDNAEQDDYNFWHDTELPHLDLIAQAFADDVEEDLSTGFDLSSVEALELPARRAREEARREWNDGLRTIKEYRPLADLPEIDNAQTRALWISPAKAPVPGQPEDAAELGLGPGGDPSMGGGGMGGPAPMGPDGTAPDPMGDPGAGMATGLPPAAAAVAEAQGDQPLDGEPGPAGAAVAEAQGDGQGAEPGPAAAAIEEAMETKSLQTALAAAPVDGGEYDPGEDELKRTELAITAALDAFLARQAGVVQARLESPKQRINTRYWNAQDTEDQRATDAPIDLTKVIDQARWSGELQQALQPILQPAAQQSSNSLLTALAAGGALVAPVATADVIGRTVQAPAASSDAITQAAGQASVGAVLLALSLADDAMRDWLADRSTELADAMHDATPLPSLVDQVKSTWADRGRTWAESLAVSIAQAVVGGARDAAAALLNPIMPALPSTTDELLNVNVPAVFRRWTCRSDDRVRDTHVHAAGQTREVGHPFSVGGFQLRYPCDPWAPASETRWCRCWLVYSWPVGSQFTLPDPAHLSLVA